MPFCPTCRAEYREGVSRCPDCDETLVDVLPPEPETVWDPTDWITVEEVGDQATASLVEGFLLEQGLPVRVLRRGDKTLVVAVGGLSGYEIQVPADDLDRALDSLAARDEALDRGDSGEDPEPPAFEG